MARAVTLANGGAAMVALGVAACIMAFPAAPTTDLGGPIVTSFADRGSVTVETVPAEAQPPAAEDQAAPEADSARSDEVTAVAVAPPAPVAVPDPGPTGPPDDDAEGNESRPATTSGPPDGTQPDGGSRAGTDTPRDGDGRSGW